MKIFEAFTGMYDCRYLPSFAQFILDHYLTDYAKEQIRLGTHMKVPLMESLNSRYTEKEIIAISLQSSAEYLTALATNNAREQLIQSMEKWLNDQLQVIGKAEIVARDITIINFIKGQSLKKFISFYTADLNQALGIAAEIDTIILGNNTTAVDIYIGLLKTKIEEQSNLAGKVIEASPAVTFLFDIIEQKQIFVSGNVTEVMGYSPEEIIGMGGEIFTKLTHPDDLQLLLGHIQNLIRSNSNRADQFEYRFRHKDGEYRWLRTYEMIFKRDGSGTPVQLLGKTFEITHEKQMALALEKREKQLLEAQSIAQIGSYEWNIPENVSSNTAELHRIFSMDESQHFEEFMSFVHPEDLDRVKDAISRAFNSGSYECEYRYVKNNIEKVVWSLGKVEFRNGIPFRMIGTVQDVTRIKKMEKELFQKGEELERSNESLRQFAYVASHDMKEPLRKIIMFSEMVLAAEQRNISEKSMINLQKMKSAGQRLHGMVEDILSFSLLESRENKVRTNLNALIADVTELLEDSIKQKNAKLITALIPDAEVIPSQFRQLFQNLISNSIKFTDHKTEPIIKIKGSLTEKPPFLAKVKANKYLELTIEDNGIGFPEEATERIFELFNRIHPKTKYEGTGLGLSISRKIVDNHDGTIRAFPGKECGAVFSIVIPQSNVAR